jgi:hypothetical protein
MVTEQKKDDSPRVAQAKAAILAAKSGQGKKSKRSIYSEVTRTDEEAEDTGKDKYQEFSTKEKIKTHKNLLGQTVVKIKSEQTPNDVEPYNSGKHTFEAEPSSKWRESHSKHDKKEKYKITFKGDPEDNNYTEKVKQAKEKYQSGLKFPYLQKAGYGSKEKTFTTTKDGEKTGFRTEKHKSKRFFDL